MYKEQFSRYLAVEYKGDQWLVAQSLELPDRLYHWGGMAYMNVVPGIKILKEYILRDKEGYIDGDLCEIQFHKDFPPKSSVTGTTGWLSPDGKFYACTYAQHDQLANALCGFVYGVCKGRSYLEDKNWIWFGRGRGYVHTLKEKPTTEQINFIVDMSNIEGLDPEVLNKIKQTLDSIMLHWEDSI